MCIFANDLIKTCRTALAGGLIFFAMTAAQAEQTFHLTGDRQVQGSLIALNKNNIIIHRDMGGMAQFAIRDLKRIDIATSTGDLISGRLVAFDNGVFDIVDEDLIWSVRDGEILAKRSQREDESTAENMSADKSQQSGAGGPVIAIEPVDITIRPSAVREDAESLHFNVTLNPAPTESVALIYTTMGKSAISDEDYVSTQGVLSIPSGTTAIAIDVPLLDDDLAEGDESVTLFVTADPDVANLRERQIEGIILDDD